MIKAVIFDYGKVLGSDANEWDIYFKEISELTGLSAEELDEIWNYYWQELKIGKITLNLVWEKVIFRSQKKVTVKELNKVYLENVSLNPEMLILVQELKAKNFQTVILTNESKEGLEAKIKKFTLNKIFYKIYSSSKLGLAKPARKIYEYVLNDLKLLPEEVVFIDNLERNVLPARELGMKGICFKNIQQLREELKFMGLL